MISKRDKNNTANIKKLSKELDIAVEDKNEEVVICAKILIYNIINYMFDLF